MSTVFVMIDGLRPDAIEAADCPNLTNLIARSAHTLSARSVMPSVTLPCHMSIFHSVPPERHGVTSNDWHPMARPLPGLVEQAAHSGKKCAFFISWEPLRDLSRPLNLHHLYFARDARAFDYGDQRTAARAAEYITANQPDFAFVYFGTVDEMGHDAGWMSPDYLRQVARVDEALGIVLAVLGDEDYVLLQADHGGHERMHGTDMAEDLTIPWLVAGPGIRSGYRIEAPVSLLDTAPTLARLLGIAPDSQWEGRCVEEAFAGAAK